jgi:hypothetical protein
MTNGFANTAVGYIAMQNTSTGHWNTAVGYQALSGGTSGEQNTAIGASVLPVSTGTNNTGTGYLALNANTTGNGNTATGFEALFFNQLGGGNTAVGADALETNVSGNLNTAIGLTADVSTDGLTNATAIGYATIVNASNKVRIGNGAVTVIEGQVPFTTPSDGRYKFNVEENVKGLDFILKLRPVTYQFDVKRFDARQTRGKEQQSYAMTAAYDEAERMRRTGFIAQEVEKAAAASGYDFSGIIRPKTEQDHYSLSYDAFVVPLVKAVQEQQQIIADLQRQIDELKKHIK